MLRALGIVFIAGCCFVVGLIGCTAAYFLLKSDAVRNAMHQAAISAVDATKSRQVSPQDAEDISEPKSVRSSVALTNFAFEEPQAESGTIALLAPISPVPPAAAGFFVGQPPATPPPPPLPTTTYRIVDITDPTSTRKWQCDFGRPSTVLLDGTTADVRLQAVSKADPKADLAISAEDVTALQGYFTGNPDFTVVVQAEPADKRQRVVTLTLKNPTAVLDYSFIVSRPVMTLVGKAPNAAAPPPPAVSAVTVSSNLYATINNPDSKQVTSVYDLYFRLTFSVNVGPDVARPIFFLAGADGSIQSLVPDSLAVVAAGPAYTYEASFNRQVPKQAGNFTVFAVALNGMPGGHTFSGPILLSPKARLVAPGPKLNVTPPASLKGVTGGTTLYTKEADAEFTISGVAGVLDNSLAITAQEGTSPLNSAAVTADNQKFKVNLSSLSAGPHVITFRLVQGDEVVAAPLSLTVERLTTGPKVREIDDRLFRSTPEGKTVYLYFENPGPIDKAADKSHIDATQFDLIGTTGTPISGGVVTAAWDDKLNALAITLTSGLQPGRYRLKTATGLAIVDAAGNAMVPLDPTDLDKLIDAVPPTAVAGVRPTGAPFVVYPEFNPPRDPTNGFNPSDKTITRIARLYYFRDAHRVAQIVNRKAQSYNRIGTEMTRQLADKTARQADVATDDRLTAERDAVRSAQSARQAEEALAAQQKALIQYRETLARTQESLDLATSDLAQNQAELNNVTANLAGATTSRDRDTARSKELKANQNAVPATITETEKTELADIEVRLPGTLKLVASLTEQQQTLQVTVAAQSAAKSSLETRRTAASDFVTNTQAIVSTLLAQVSTERDSEITATERWNVADRKELRAREEQFRREVAAAKEDPDTFAPGAPGSIDPVEQVSITVVGEGLIQLRGPRKGVNIVHAMINELDAPVGQVHVAMHTIQINGEHAERMEPVALYIERYLDHARFLTSQSAQYLRNAVVQVASEKADQVLATMPGECEPALRERRYREVFFGKDFLDELGDLDSEFLKADNKVLSLHSMDTTSLASALFLLALAKNDTREEILARFEGLVRCKLPMDERTYFKASDAKCKIGPCLHKSKFVFLADNAAFVNLKGFFQNDVYAPDTLTPAQREFVRLAQIYKARLVTEIELRQRVMERALIEERIGVDYRDQLRKAAEQDAASEERIRQLVVQRQDLTQLVVAHFAQLKARALSQLKIPTVKYFLPEDAVGRGARAQASRPHSGATDDDIKNTVDASKSVSNKSLDQTLTFPYREYNVTLHVKTDNTTEFACVSDVRGECLKGTPLDSFKAVWEGDLQDTYNKNLDFLRFTATIRLSQQHLIMRERELAFLSRITDGKVDPNNYKHLLIVSISSFRCTELKEHIESVVGQYSDQASEMTLRLGRADSKVESIFKQWQELRTQSLSYLLNPLARAQFETELIKPIDEGFSTLIEQEAKVRLARSTAEQLRRPLDHKKFLDMLIDDVEEKHIELVEGTRAHTANVDNYVKRLATALDDDFNTQFYHPAFRHVREISTSWDVQLGQVETTSILANNRAFAKVSPQATMEFDLPKRDILIKEAFDSALAAYNDYGALLGDPNFLALARLHGGQPAAQTYGGNQPAPMVRDVLPGLPSQTDARYLSQSENNVPEIGSNLEALIPDPAVYKFETGTGYEIRPVIQPDGQAVVFHLNYMYTTNIREPIRADEKHLGRVKRHFIDTDVQLGNYELRKVSRFTVALKAARTSRGVPLLEDVPVAGVLFRPLPSQESSLQQNLILAQSVIFPTLFDLMGLRWAPAVADLGTVNLREREFVTRGREQYLRNEVFDYSSLQVDDFMRIPEAERRPDLYRTQESIPYDHPNGYAGRGVNIESSHLQEGYDVQQANPESVSPFSSGPRLPPAAEGQWMEAQPEVFRGAQGSFPVPPNRRPGVVLPAVPSLPSAPVGAGSLQRSGFNQPLSRAPRISDQEVRPAAVESIRPVDVRPRTQPAPLPATQNARPLAAGTAGAPSRSPEMVTGQSKGQASLDETGTATTSAAVGNPSWTVTKPRDRKVLGLPVPRVLQPKAKAAQNAGGTP